MVTIRQALLIKLTEFATKSPVLINTNEVVSIFKGTNPYTIVQCHHECWHVEESPEQVQAELVKYYSTI